MNKTAGEQREKLSTLEKFLSPTGRAGIDERKTETSIKGALYLHKQKRARHTEYAWLLYFLGLVWFICVVATKSPMLWLIPGAVLLLPLSILSWAKDSKQRVFEEQLRALMLEKQTLEWQIRQAGLDRIEQSCLLSSRGFVDVPIGDSSVAGFPKIAYDRYVAQAEKKLRQYQEKTG